MFESLLFRPNFPTAPQRSFDFFTFPNDLVTDNRNYYTEIEFYEYDSGFSILDGVEQGTLTGSGQNLGGALGGGITGGAAGAAIGALRGAITRRSGAGVVLGALSGGAGGAVIGAATGAIVDNAVNNRFYGQGYKPGVLGSMRLPIPQRINDSLAFSWGTDSLTEISGQILRQFVPFNNIAQGGLLATGLAAKGFGVAEGIALNPLMFQSFQSPNFREFQFQWLLAPRTKTESATIASMISLLKRAASPGKAVGGFVLKYPSVVMIKFNPNNLNGGVKLKPCIIQAISIDHTPVSGPAFFRGPEGAPVVVGITISVKELQLWYREDYMQMESSAQNQQLPNTPERYTSQSGTTNPERAG